MLKRMICLLLCLCTVLCFVPMVSAATTASGTCGKNAKWSYNDGTLTISGSGAIQDYLIWNAEGYYDYIEMCLSA